MHALPSPATAPREILPRSCAAIENGMRVGLHIGAQLCVVLEGRTLADFGMGESRPGVAMQADTIMLWLSAGKPIGAAAILQLYERGRLDLHDPVARHVSEFAQNGKQNITLWHLLTHTCGFRWVDIDWPRSSWSEIIRRICAARPEPGWIAGQKAGYHPFTSWYILGEVVRRIDGRTYSDYVRDEIFLPLAMIDSWVGVPLDQYQAYGDRFGIMQHLEKAEPYAHRYDSASGAGVCVPGGNAHGPMHDLARFYEMLLEGGQLAGTRVLSPESVALLTTPERVGMFDETFKHVLDWSLGLIVDSNRYGVDTVPYGYGKYCSPRTFGLGGKESSVGFADPDRKLAVAVVFNGMPGERKHDVRMRGLLEGLYEDLGLV